MRHEARRVALGGARPGALSLSGVLFVASCGRVGFELTPEHGKGRDASMQVVDSGPGDTGAAGSGGSSSGGAPPASGGAGAADASGAAGREGGVSSGGAAPADAGAPKDAGVPEDAAIDAAVDAGPR